MSNEASAGGSDILDRVLQRSLLTQMRMRYPDTCNEFVDVPADTKSFLANIAYLREHGLCNVHLQEGMVGPVGWAAAKITARGLDFLADDGGLSAILGVVTIQIHADTIRRLIETRVDEAHVSAEQKSIIKEHLRKLPGTALQLASTDLMKQGLDHLPDAIHWLRTLGVPV